jgi:hypothetical protein
METGRSTLSVRCEENPPSNPEICSICALKERWIETGMHPLGVPDVELHVTIKAFLTVARLSKIAHLIRESVHTRICCLVVRIPRTPLRLLPRF